MYSKLVITTACLGALFVLTQGPAVQASTQGVWGHWYAAQGAGGSAWDLVLPVKKKKKKKHPELAPEGHGGLAPEAMVPPRAGGPGGPAMDNGPVNPKHKKGPPPGWKPPEGGPEALGKGGPAMDNGPVNPKRKKGPPPGWKPPEGGPGAALP